MKNILITVIVIVSLLFTNQSFFAQCHVLFILDDSGSIAVNERADMTVSVQALADQIEINNPNIKIGVIQYSYSLTAVKTPRFYDIESGFVSNPTILNTKQPTNNDHLPAAIAEMESDGLFSPGGMFETTGAIFIFTDAARQFNVTTLLEQYPPNTADYCQNYNLSCDTSPFYEEYSDLSAALGGIPISVYRVGTFGGSAVGMEQGGGIITEGVIDFTMTPTEITTFAQNINVNCQSTNNCAGGIINGNVIASSVLCPGGSTGSATANPTGGTAPYSYLWSNGLFTSTISNLPAGPYSVTITDANGCFTSQLINITDPTPLVTNVTTNPATCTGNNGGASITANGGTTPYTYLWSNGQTTAQLSNVSAGNYSYTVTDDNGCFVVGSVMISAPSSIGTTTTTNPATCGGSNGGATITVNGGTAPFTYLWSNGQTTAQLSNVSAGSYSYTVTDANGCIDIGSVNVTSPSSLGSTVTPNPASCGSNNGGATITVNGGTAPFSYLWSNGQTTPQLTNVSPGSYSYTVTDANGCYDTGMTTIASSTSLNTTTTTNHASCHGLQDGEATIIINGGTTPFSYQWSNGSTSPQISNVSAGSYSYTVTDALGCSNTGTITIQEPSALTLTVNSNDVSCYGDTDGQAIANVQGGTPPFQYSWSNGENKPTAIAYAVGNHDITVTDANGCTIISGFSIGSPAELQVVPSNSNPVTCHGGDDGSGLVSVNGGTPPYSYYWSDAQITNPAIGLSAGTYSVTVSDANGCRVPTSVSILEPGTPISLVINNTSVSCFGLADGSVTVSANGGNPGYTYLWSNGGTTSELLGVASGNFMVTVTDQNGCQAVATTFVETPVMITAQAETEDATCHGYEDGSVVISNPSGGVGPYLYSINNGPFGVDNVFNGVGAGNYAFTIQDMNGCETELTSIQVTDKPPILINLPGLMEVELGEEIQLVPLIHQASQYTYLWTPSEGLSCSDCVSPFVTPTETQTYTLQVTNPDGCVSQSSITIEVNKDRNVFIPNIFTPNEDGTNDMFVVFGGTDVSNIKVMNLYDKWGELVFSGADLAPNDPSNGWDGQFRGKPLKSEVFVYYLEVEFVDGEVIPYKGDFTLLR